MAMPLTRLRRCASVLDMGGDGSIDEKLGPGDFVGDFVWAARAVFAQPGVALVSIALWVLPVLVPSLGQPGRGSPAIAAFLLLYGLFALGWLGAERLFFLRRQEGKPVSLRELLTSAPGFVGRFFRLAMLLGVVGLPLSFVIGYCTGRIGAAAPDSALAAGKMMWLLLVMVPIDLALTFVTSALAYTTSSARQALRIGLAMIRQTWPRSGLYVLCPALALNLLNTIYTTDIRVVRLVTTAGLALLALLAKGAIAAFYLRARPVVPAALADAR
jgi:hypothetical protein